MYMCANTWHEGWTDTEVIRISEIQLGNKTKT